MPIEQIVVTSEQPSGRELAVDLAALRAWVLTELKRIDERHATYKENVKETLDLLERQTSTRFADQADNVRIALSAQKELNATVALSSEKAIQKAEEAQKGVNERSNEFRQQLKDQNETMIPRSEAEQVFRELGLRIDRSGASIIATVTGNDERASKDITALREARSRDEGRLLQGQEGKQDNRWMWGAGVGVLALIFAAMNSGVLSGRTTPVVPLAPVYAPAPPLAPAPPINIIVPGGGGGQPSIGPGSPGTVTDTKSTTVPK